MKLLILQIQPLFLIFMIYAVLGWCMETVLKSIPERHFVNRGFLIGPYCPIYGYGALILTILLQKYQGDIFALFLMSFFLCSILEYLTSYLMEKLFKARWWDYSQKHFQLNGRICLQNSLFFGVGGVLLIRVFNPVLLDFLTIDFTLWTNLVTGLLLLLFLIDNFVSFHIINSFKRTALAEVKDDTEEISIQVREVVNDISKKWTKGTKHWLVRKKKNYQDRTRAICAQFSKNSLLRTRLINAFPKLQVKITKKKP